MDDALPSKCFDQNGVLTIPNLRPEDEGKYFCTASNQFEIKSKEVTLQVGGEINVMDNQGKTVKNHKTMLMY